MPRLSHTKHELKEKGYTDFGCAVANGKNAFVRAGNKYYPMEINKEDEGCIAPANKSLEYALQVQ